MKILDSFIVTLLLCITIPLKAQLSTKLLDNLSGHVTYSHVIDFDNDSLYDIVYFKSQGDSLFWKRNNGQSFDHQSFLLTNSTQHEDLITFSFGDVNNDGYPDVIN